MLFPFSSIETIITNWLWIENLLKSIYEFRKSYRFEMSNIKRLMKKKKGEEEEERNEIKHPHGTTVRRIGIATEKKCKGIKTNLLIWYSEIKAKLIRSFTVGSVIVISNAVHPIKWSTSYNMVRLLLWAGERVWLWPRRFIQPPIFIVYVPLILGERNK